MELIAMNKTRKKDRAVVEMPKPKQEQKMRSSDAAIPCPECGSDMRQTRSEAIANDDRYPKFVGRKRTLRMVRMKCPECGRTGSGTKETIITILGSERTAG